MRVMPMDHQAQTATPAPMIKKAIDRMPRAVGISTVQRVLSTRIAAKTNWAATNARAEFLNWVFDNVPTRAGAI